MAETVISTKCPNALTSRKFWFFGSGPIVIGQSAEFDYSGTQACKALEAEGFEVVLANSNPATIMTDPESADRTYIEPLTLNISKNYSHLARTVSERGVRRPAYRRRTDRAQSRH